MPVTLERFTDTPTRRLTPVRRHADLRTTHCAKVAPTLTKKRLQVYEALKAAGEVTAKELAARMDWDINSVRPRVSELCKKGLAEPTGARRDDQYVFRAKSD